MTVGIIIELNKAFFKCLTIKTQLFKIIEIKTHEKHKRLGHD